MGDFRVLAQMPNITHFYSRYPVFFGDIQHFENCLKLMCFIFPFAPLSNSIGQTFGANTIRGNCTAIDIIYEPR